MEVSLTPFGVNFTMSPEQFAALCHLAANVDYEDYKKACVRNSDLIMTSDAIDGMFTGILAAGMNAGFLTQDLEVTEELEARGELWDDEAIVQHSLDGEPVVRSSVTYQFDIPVSAILEVGQGAA